MDKLLLIDDEADMQYSFRRIFDSPEIRLTTASSGEEGLKLFPTLKPDLVIMDIRMGGLSGLETLRRMRQIDARVPVIMMTAYGTTQTAIEAMKLGAYDYLLKPFDVPKLKQVVFAALKAARDMKRVVSFEPLLETEDYELGIVGRCEPIQSVFKLIGQVAASDATALITGESGTGKELVARAIYSHSRRAQQPFVAINCAAIPENLLESELFGHERGAFTGATSQRIGKFEQCQGGTIFLDEIGDMLLPIQTKILRVLQDGTFERVGGNETVKVDVRIIAATNQALEQAVAERRFREDLFYRLNVVRIQLPPRHGCSRPPKRRRRRRRRSGRSMSAAASSARHGSRHAPCLPRPAPRVRLAATGCFPRSSASCCRATAASTGRWRRASTAISASPRPMPAARRRGRRACCCSCRTTIPAISTVRRRCASSASAAMATKAARGRSIATCR